MSDTIFGKIISGEIPSEFLYEDEHCIAINDINPQAPVHVLVIPKGEYISMVDFSSAASDIEIVDFNRAVGEVAKIKGLIETGYRTLANHGTNARQDVFHYHVHVVGGRDLGGMIKKES